ncbi:glutamate receptor ionotropic, kainate 4-like isoform X1 [Daphnia carinata]|uniref:glutamate receptor ionotropic, kainate 4-like isoform X1 n=2 Tax=Daphnia carinata TaxID=120202 RepID=UPI00257EB862|nr:glutamate receptor ionotropic, kainate 4-like isoform X1 [Daphnia carinata]XP_059353236.1 glutamate receptor ionotropic, kainate 4-like isoform X1 [Daphnia carinata]
MFAAWALFYTMAQVLAEIHFEKVDHLYGKHLIVATADLNPYMYVHHDENGTIDSADGIVNEMMLWLAQRYHFTFHYVESSDGYFGAFVNESWNGMVGMAVRKEIDLIATQLTTTYARSKVIDFTTSFSKDPMSAIIPAPKEDGFMAAIVKPFQPGVWALIMISMFSATLVTFTFMKLIHKYMPEYYDGGISNLQFWENFMYYFGIISSQAGRTMPSVGPLGHATRLLAATWCLTAVVFIYLYSGCLTSFITIPKLRPLIESLDDLATSVDLKLTLLKNSVFESIILEATSGTYKALGDSLRNNPENRLPKDFLEPEIFLKHALIGRFAMVDQKSFLEYVLNLAFKTSGKCDITLMKQEVVTSLDSMAVQKNSIYLAQIDQGFQTMAALGLQNYWEKRFLKVPKCEGNLEKGVAKPRLTLANLSGAFLFLLVGIGISFAVFLVENMWSCMQKGKGVMERSKSFKVEAHSRILPS